MLWLISVMLHLTYVSGKKFEKPSGRSIKSQIGEGTISCFENADLSKAILVTKIQINWTNIDVKL